MEKLKNSCFQLIQYDSIEHDFVLTICLKAGNAKKRIKKKKSSDSID